MIGRFNSRAHGARDRNRLAADGHRGVSIHARTGRATCTTTRPGSRSTCFNSRAHGARDPPPPRSGGNEGVFQFTRARGARPAKASSCHTSRRFQFTRARGARRPAVPPVSAPPGFNSRAHGARDSTSRRSPSPPTGTFQFTRARGARHEAELAVLQGRAGFNSRAHGARDPLAASCHLSSPQFQFTRARGARLVGVETVARCRVSIHARTGRAT